MKRYTTYFLVVAFLASTAAFGATGYQASVEKQILDWGQERLDELIKNRKPVQADEWQKQIDKKNYEWICVNLIVYYSLQKVITEALIPKNRPAPKLEETVRKLKKRLVTLGWYIQTINED